MNKFATCRKTLIVYQMNDNCASIAWWMGVRQPSWTNSTITQIELPLCRHETNAYMHIHTGCFYCIYIDIEKYIYIYMYNTKNIHIYVYSIYNIHTECLKLKHCNRNVILHTFSWSCFKCKFKFYYFYRRIHLIAVDHLFSTNSLKF